MRRKVWLFTTFVVLMGLSLLLSACGRSPKQQAETSSTQGTVAVQSAPAAEEPLAGDYVIDITDLGMALQFYLRINEDNTFVLAPNRQFTSERGSGKIGELEGTYVMIYSDSTPESPKTATFEREGPNLVFKTTLPYGTANIMYERVDEENPDMIYRLVAHKYIYEEYYDTYLAFVEEEGRRYDYVLNLLPGARYSFKSSLEGSQLYEETGTFRVAGQNLFITPEGGTELRGSVNDAGALELAFKPRAEEERSTTLFRVATTAQHAGTWLAQTAAGGEARLELDYFGDYTFTAGELSERGSFTADQRSITLSPEQGETREGSKTPYTLTAAFGTEELLFYNSQILGRFSGGTMGAESIVAQLELGVDGQYQLTIVDEANGIELLQEKGTFSIVPGPMAYQLALESEGAKRVGDIWPTGFNMSFNIDGTDYRFLLTF